MSLLRPGVIEQHSAQLVRHEHFNNAKTVVSIRTFSVIYDHTFLNLQITRPDIRPHMKWAVSLVIAYMATLIFLRELCGNVWVNILTLSPPRVLGIRISHNNIRFDIKYLTSR